MNTCEKYGYKLAEAGKLLRVEEDVFVPIRTPMSTLRWRRRYGRYLPEWYYASQMSWYLRGWVRD